VNVFNCSTYEDCGPETQNGRTFKFDPVLARFVRYYSSRNSRLNRAHFLEIRVMGALQGPYLKPCRSCDAGTYKSSSGSAGCALCPRDTFSAELADVYLSDCEPCAHHSHSSMGSHLSTNCTCNIGYTGADGGPCPGCRAGKYKNVNGSVPCTHCPAGQATAFRCTSLVNPPENARVYSTRVKVGGNKWELCANEGDNCTCSGSVRYGSKDTDVWVTKDVTGSFVCETAYFIFDPRPGHSKICQCYKLPDFPSGLLDSNIGWGAAEVEILENCWGCQWVTMDLGMTKSVDGVAMQGSASWKDCAAEDQQCVCPDYSTVRYGAGDSWVQLQTHSFMGEALTMSSRVGSGEVEAAASTMASVHCSSQKFGGDPAPGISKRCQCADTWVTKFAVAYSSDDVEWQELDAVLYQTSNIVNSGDYYRALFADTVQARYVKLLPLQWVTAPIFRAGVLVQQIPCEAAATSCVECVAGKYAQDAGRSICSRCTAGKFLSTAGGTSMDSCRECASGKYSSQPAAVSELACEFCMTFGSIAIGATGCTDCPVGTFGAPTKGCSLDVSCPLGGTTCQPFTAPNRQGYISTGPGLYANMQHMQWIINADCGTDTLFKFYLQSLDTEACCDRVRLFKCTNLDCSNKTLLMNALSGNVVDATLSPYTSVGSMILLVDFRSDASVTGNGFDASFTVGDPCTQCPAGTYSSVRASACVPTLQHVILDNPPPTEYEDRWYNVPVALAGNFTDGSGMYKANTMWLWQIQTVCGDIVLKIDKLDIEAQADSLQIWQCDHAVSTNIPYAKCADDNVSGNASQCICPGTKRNPGKARFGNGSNWLVRETLDSIRCDSKAFFSDPAPGRYKWCECISGGDPCESRTQLFNSVTGGYGLMSPLDRANEYRSTTGVMLVEFQIDSAGGGTTPENSGFEASWQWQEYALDGMVLDRAWRWTGVEPLNKVTDRFHAVCNECPGGTVNGQTGRADSTDCIECDAGKYSSDEVAASVCQNCVATSNSPARSDNYTDCICNAGYTGVDGSSCPACAGGTFKPANGSASCFLCPRDTFSIGLAETSADTCVVCVNHTSSPNGSDSALNCICNKGFTGEGGALGCEACAPGTFKSSNGSLPCNLCARDTYAPETGLVYAHECSFCPNFTSSLDGSDAVDDCICNQGFSGIGGRALMPPKVQFTCGGLNCNCSGCATPGVFESNQGSICEGPGQYLPNAKCAYTLSAQGAFESLNFTFTSLYTEHGWDDVSLGDGASPANLEAPTSINKGPGYRFYRFKNVAQRCTTCPGSDYVGFAEIEFKTTDGDSVSPLTVTNPNGTSPDGQGPLMVIDGSYTTKWLDQTFGHLEFDFGAANHAVISNYSWWTAEDLPERDPISWDVEGMHDGGTWILLHRAANYNTTTERNAKVGPFVIVSPSLAVYTSKGVFHVEFTSDSSVQYEGWTADWSLETLDDTTTCRACLPGSYKTINGTAACTPCRAGTFSGEIGRREECSQECPAGTYSMDGFSTCTLCAPGKYSSGTAQISEATCVGCPANSNSGEGSNDSTNCKCNVGFVGTDGGDCIGSYVCALRTDFDARIHGQYHSLSLTRTH